MDKQKADWQIPEAGGLDMEKAGASCSVVSACSTAGGVSHGGASFKGEVYEGMTAMPLCSPYLIDTRKRSLLDKLAAGILTVLLSPLALVAATVILSVAAGEMLWESISGLWRKSDEKKASIPAVVVIGGACVVAFHGLCSLLFDD